MAAASDPISFKEQVCCRRDVRRCGNVHDPYPPGHNPHAHIMLTVRPLDENGKLAVQGRERISLCIRRTAKNGALPPPSSSRHRPTDGRSSTSTRCGKKEGVYGTRLPPQAQGYERVSTNIPKSTKYGRTKSHLRALEQRRTAWSSGARRGQM